MGRMSGGMCSLLYLYSAVICNYGNVEEMYYVVRGILNRNGSSTPLSDEVDRRIGKIMEEDQI